MRQTVVVGGTGRTWCWTYRKSVCGTRRQRSDPAPPMIHPSLSKSSYALRKHWKGWSNISHIKQRTRVQMGMFHHRDHHHDDVVCLAVGTSNAWKSSIRECTSATSSREPERGFSTRCASMTKSMAFVPGMEGAQGAH